MYKKQTQSGFTMVETLIYISIIGGVISTFISFSLSITGTRNKTFVMQEVLANSRTALQYINQKILAASEVAGPIEGNSATSLELEMDGIGDNLVFSVTDGVLYVTEGTSDPIALTSSAINITDLQFTNLSEADIKDNIRINMTTAYRYNSTKEFDYSLTLRTGTSLRR